MHIGALHLCRQARARDLGTLIQLYAVACHTLAAKSTWGLALAPELWLARDRYDLQTLSRLHNRESSQQDRRC